MSPLLPEHEIKHNIQTQVEIFARDLDIDVRGLGSADLSQLARWQARAAGFL